MDIDPLKITSPKQEESRLVGKWLRQLHKCLRPDQENLFRSALISVDTRLDTLDEDSKLSQHQFDIVLNQLRESIPDITLRLFSSLDVLDHGLIGYAAASSDTLAKAIDIFDRFHDISSDRFQPILEIDGDNASIRPVPLLNYIGDFRDVSEDCLAGSLQFVRLMLGEQYDPQKIKASFYYPAPEYVATYIQVFGENCQFDANCTALTFPASWLDKPVATANLAMADISKRFCERILGTDEERENTAQAVRRLLLSRSERRIPRLEETAEKMYLSTAQLRKRLYRAGTSYKQLVLEVRMVLAKHYLEDTRLSIQEIAYLLDYSQNSPFDRAFKRYYDATPMEWREGANRQ